MKPPTNVLWQPEAEAAYEKANVDISTMAARIKHVMQATFNGRRAQTRSTRSSRSIMATRKDGHQPNGEGRWATSALFFASQWRSPRLAQNWK
ncbi:MAG: hypothetical protein ACK4JB_01265 [Reyranella sp.]